MASRRSFEEDGSEIERAILKGIGYARVAETGRKFPFS